jgi:hypothetical protein
MMAIIGRNTCKSFILLLKTSLRLMGFNPYFTYILAISLQGEPSGLPPSDGDIMCDVSYFETLGVWLFEASLCRNNVEYTLACYKLLQAYKT